MTTACKHDLNYRVWLVPSGEGNTNSAHTEQEARTQDVYECIGGSSQVFTLRQNIPGVRGPLCHPLQGRRRVASGNIVGKLRGYCVGYRLVANSYLKYCYFSAHITYQRHAYKLSKKVSIYPK